MCILLGAAVYGLQQASVRIERVAVYGAPQSLADLATAKMQGRYLGIIPRDSIFFFPSSAIRSAILTTYPDIAAISIFRSGFATISLRVDYRVPIARWCGDASRFDLTASSSRSNLDASGCYVFDANGFVYATSSTANLMNAFVIYGPIANATTPIQSTLSNAFQLPATFTFARELASFGSAVTKIVFREDEVDEYLASGTRVTYLAGDEQNAYTALVSARTNFSLADGSVEYLDLRFPGKVYLKKKE